MSTSIITLIPIATDLLISLIKVAKEAKELSTKDFESLKKRLDREFSDIPTYDEL